MEAAMQQLAYAMQSQGQMMHQLMQSQQEQQQVQNQLITKLMAGEGDSGGGSGGGKGGGGSRSQEDRLNGKAMTAVDRFKGGETEWVDWKFKFLNAVGTGSKAMREVLQWVEDNHTGKGDSLTARQRRW